jgi:hypothetical protein
MTPEPKASSAAAAAAATTPQEGRALFGACHCSSSRRAAPPLERGPCALDTVAAMFAKTAFQIRFWTFDDTFSKFRGLKIWFQKYTDLFEIAIQV